MLTPRARKSPSTLSRYVFQIFLPPVPAQPAIVQVIVDPEFFFLKTLRQGIAITFEWYEKILMGGSHAKRKHEVGGAYAWPKPALRGRLRPPGQLLAPPRASWKVWWRARRCAWSGVASRYRPREKVPKNTYLEKPILTQLAPVQRTLY